MSGIFSRKFHKQTDFNFAIGSLPSNRQYWPKEWKEIQHKEYPRFPKIKLSEKLIELDDLKECIFKRRSSREFDLNKKISFEELSTIVYYSAGVNKMRMGSKDEVRRFYPSGGARYPLELYLAVQRVDGMYPGIYHYNVKDNSLETLTTEPMYMDLILEGLLYPWSRDAAVIVFITAVWDRNFIKYKDRGYRIVLMEAGHMAHNLSLVSASLGVKICNSVGFNNNRINQVLDTENEDEDSLYMAVTGR